jgi:hypothetical protein
MVPRRVRVPGFALVLLVCAFCTSVHAQQGHPTHRHALEAADYDARTAVLSAPVAAKNALVSAVFDVTYDDFSAEARAAFEYALSIWATHISSPVPIRVHARWTALETNTLGSAGPAYLVSFSGQPEPNTWYPPALAAAISGQRQPLGDGYDIVASFNSTRADWYFGTDGATPVGTYDFVTVVMHEIGHGTGMIGSFRMAEADGNGGNTCSGASEGQACWGYIASGAGPSQTMPIVTDRRVHDAFGSLLIDSSAYPNPSESLSGVLTAGSVYVDGPTVRLAHGDEPARLYAPSTYQPASSIAHLDEQTFPAGDPNSLMTPSLARAEAIHSPGPIFCGILSDIGWPLGEMCLALIADADSGIGDDDGAGDNGDGNPGAGDDYGDGTGNGEDDGDDGDDDDGTTTGAGIPTHNGRALMADGPYPNPAAASASIVIESGTSGRVTVTVNDMLGRERAHVSVHVVAGGRQSVDLPVSDLEPGVYVVRIEGSQTTLARTMVVVR